MGAAERSFLYFKGYQSICTSQQSATPTINGRTTRSNRKVSPEETQRKRRRVTEVVNQYNSSNMVNGQRGRKRKVREDDQGPSQTKKRRGLTLKESASSSVDTGRESSSKPLEGCTASVNDVIKKSSKRTASNDTNDGEGPSRKKGKRYHIKDTNIKTPKETRKDLSVDPRRAEFDANYKQQHQLGQGGCGSVFAGYRRADNLPVAIKHVPKDNVYCKAANRNGKEVSVEVAVMLKLATGRAGSVGTSAPVSLLDWYDLGQELILVLERPVPCEDLHSYIGLKGGCLQEEKAKIILKQLLEAAVELKKKHIFHRDIKVQNILIETGTDVPHVRIIDFGLSCFFKKTSTYQVFYGTPAHVPPEWFSRYRYRAGPTTVWQLGVVLFDTLHLTAFETTRFLRDELEISCGLSTNCQDFLQICSSKVPEQCPTLEQLRLHPWLR